MTKKQVRLKDVEDELGKYRITLSKKDHVELENDKILSLNHQPCFFYYEGKLVPTLHYLLQHPAVFNKITVDMGAVKFVVSGADIMRPGIVSIESKIVAGDFVVVVDVNNKKTLAVGIALFSSAEMQEMKIGKVVKNIHWVGDAVWRKI